MHASFCCFFLQPYPLHMWLVWLFKISSRLAIFYNRPDYYFPFVAVDLSIPGCKHICLSIYVRCSFPGGALRYAIHSIWIQNDVIHGLPATDPNRLLATYDYNCWKSQFELFTCRTHAVHPVFGARSLNKVKFYKTQVCQATCKRFLGFSLRRS